MKFSFKSFDFIKDHAPDRSAIIGSNRTATWQHFEKEVNELVSFFIAGKIPKDQPIIIYGHKETEMVIAAYACMKYAVPYIPIDTVYPEDRIKKISEIAGVNLLINCTDKTSPVEFNQELRISPNKLTVNPNIPKRVSSVKIPAEDPIVYIIFTSGSTGEPKGVQITRSALLSFQEWIQNDFGFSEKDVFINQAPFSFDLSVYELMSFSGLGATLLLNTSETGKNADAFIERVKQHNGSIWVSTPSFAFLYSHHPQFTTANIPHMNCFLFCGETLPNSLAKKLKTLFPGSRVLNTYGPTEATVATTLVEITTEIARDHDPLPVGYPKSTCKIHIGSEAGQEGGEIQIIGDNVSIGYLNREDLNKEKFLLRDGKRAFNTGDWGYFKNGMLFFTGRKDDQIKLHGFRIELDEINAALHKLESVEDGITIPMRKNNEVKKLVAVLKISNSLQENEKPLFKLKLSELLKKSLPEYMVPGDIRFTDSFPYNSNHKIDKKILEEWILNGKII